MITFRPIADGARIIDMSDGCRADSVNIGAGAPAVVVVVVIVVDDEDDTA